MSKFPKDLRGMPADKDLRQTPKNWGKRKIVGVIRNGKYVNPATGEEIKISNKKIDIDRVYIAELGGIEYS
jgi:hypothetical protein